MNEKSKVIPLHDGQEPTLEANRIPDSTPVVMTTVGQLKELIHEVLQEEGERERRHGVRETGDHLIDRDEAERVLAVSRDWLYRYGKKLGLTRKVGGKVNYSWLAIQKFIATRKIS